MAEYGHNFGYSLVITTDNRNSQVNDTVNATVNDTVNAYIYRYRMPNTRPICPIVGV